MEQSQISYLFHFLHSSDKVFSHNLACVFITVATPEKLCYQLRIGGYILQSLRDPEIVTKQKMVIEDTPAEDSERPFKKQCCGKLAGTQ